MIMKMQHGIFDYILERDYTPQEENGWRVHIGKSNEISENKTVKYKKMFNHNHCQKKEHHM